MNMINKLKNNAGTSFVEMLATVALLGIMGVALVVGVSTIHKTHSQIVRKANEQTLLSTTLIEMRNEIRKSVDFKDEGTEIRFKSKDGYWFSFVNPTGEENGIQIQYYYMNESGTLEQLPNTKKPVVSKSNGLISGLFSNFGSITKYNSVPGAFVIDGLTVKNGTDTPVVLETYIVKQVVKQIGGSE